ncbi:hypothetical protein SAMN05216188_13077 [Lentzea xinjiangensis]|uniref:Uncharacterized protein n=1 Tax=Lentzea xinjiangensis TaxID=402600 RepID=A0A1H9W4F0_9PSEU|nr:hypothetical protein [Lentzea xinjiangensis]SES28830.1 hypothetical protein SAMN05216188_13077 [Lentzea xinjiangensis]
MTNTILSAAELDALLGGSAADWPGMGLTVVRGTPAAPEATGEVTVRHGEQIVGYTEQSPHHQGKRVYRAVITAGHHGVPFPAGFLPPDPLRAQHNERLRWLPEGHPDRPTEGTVRQNAYTEA